MGRMKTIIWGGRELVLCLSAPSGTAKCSHTIAPWKHRAYALGFMLKALDSGLEGLGFGV